MRTIQLRKVLAGVAMGVMLWTGAAWAEGGTPAARECTGGTPGVSLCAKVGTALHTCVQDKACGKKAARNKRSRGGLGFLSRLFI